MIMMMMIIIIIIQFISHRNMSIKSLQGRRTACDTGVYVELYDWMNKLSFE